MQRVDFCIICVKQAGDPSPLNKSRVRSRQNFPRHTSSPLVVQILVESFLAFLCLATPRNCWLACDFFGEEACSEDMGPPKRLLKLTTIFHYKPYTIHHRISVAYSRCLVHERCSLRLTSAVECPLACRIEVQRCPESGPSGDLKRTFGSLKPCFGIDSS